MVTEIGALKRRRRTRQILVTMTFALALTLGIYLVYFSEVFGLQKISVQGSKIVGSAEIIRAASIPLGTPLAQINTDEVMKNLRIFPSIGNVEVRRVWPSEIVLAITERSPVATMAMNGKWRFIDSSGVIYGETARIPEGLIPVTAESSSARGAVVQVIGSLPASIKRQVLTIVASSEDSVELTLTGSRQVFWGSATQSNRKVEVLSVLLTKRASFYDVSAPDFPTTRK